MPALIKKFTEVDPTERVSLTLKLSTRKAVEQYRQFYQKEYGHSVERGELIEQAVMTLFSQDKEFQSFIKGMSKAQTAAVDEALGVLAPATNMPSDLGLMRKAPAVQQAAPTTPAPSILS